MIKTAKRYLAGVVLIAVFLTLVGSFIRLYKVHDKLLVVDSLQSKIAEEKTIAELNSDVTKVNAALDTAIKKIDERADIAKDELKEVLNAERAKSTTEPRPAATIARIETTLPAPVPEKAPAHRLSGSTVRTVDSLWGNYCTTFPEEPSCPKKESSR